MSQWINSFKTGIGDSFNVGKAFSGTNVANALKGSAGIIGSIGGGLANNLLSMGYSSGAGNAISGVGNAVGGIVSTFNPILGGAVSLASGVLGGATNALFGTKLNKGNIAKIEGINDSLNSVTVGNGSYDSIMSQWNNQNFGFDFDRHYVGHNSVFNKGASSKYKELKNERNIALDRAYTAFTDAAKTTGRNMFYNASANLNAYGGPLFSDGAIGYDFMSRDLNNNQMKAMSNMKLTSLPNSFNALPEVNTINTFGDGGGIHIKPENRGKFTALKERTGKSSTWYKEHGTPAQKKMATFALNAAKWKHADGGLLGGNGSNFTNGAIEINNGGTHESNPFEGVQMGIDPQGVPNLVEQGEVVYDNYVYSNRMKVPKAIKEKYKIKGTTFADAARQFMKESEERPNDPISKNGLNTYMKILAGAQEELRARKEELSQMRAARKSFAKGGLMGNLFFPGGPLESPEPIITNTPIWGLENRNSNDSITSDFYYSNKDIIDSLGANEYHDEGLYKFLYDPNSEFSRRRNYYISNWDNPNFAPIKQAYLDRLKLGNPNSNFDNFTLDDFKRITSDRNFGYGHLLDAIGELAGTDAPKAGVEGKYTPVVRRWLRKKNENGEIIKEAITDDDFKADDLGFTYLMRNPNVKYGNTIVADNKDKDIYYDLVPDDPQITNVPGIRQSPLRYAPLLASGLAVANDMLGGNEPDYTNADLFGRAITGLHRPINTRSVGEYLNYNPLDRMFYVNQLNGNYASSRRAFQDLSNGNRANAAANILASDYNYIKGLGDTYRNAEEYNQALKEKVTSFNRDTNEYNATLGTDVDKFNSELYGKQASMFGTLADMRQNILEKNRAEKSANLTNLFQGIGDLGKELTDRDTLRWLADIGAIHYNTKGQYTGGNYTAAPTRANGGKINKRKKKKGYTI